MVVWTFKWPNLVYNRNVSNKVMGDMLMLELNRTNIFLNSKPKFNKLLVMFISNKIWNIYQLHDISAAFIRQDNKMAE